MNRGRPVFALSVRSVVESLLGLAERGLIVVAVKNSSLPRHRVVEGDLECVRTLAIFGFYFGAGLNSTHDVKMSRASVHIELKRRKKVRFQIMGPKRSSSQKNKPNCCLVMRPPS